MVSTAGLRLVEAASLKCIAEKYAVRFFSESEINVFEIFGIVTNGFRTSGLAYNELTTVPERNALLVKG